MSSILINGSEIFGFLKFAGFAAGLVGGPDRVIRLHEAAGPDANEDGR